MSDFGLTLVDYSTISKKASSVDYEITKRLFHILANKCNRSTRRALDLPKDLLAIDSTTITVGKNRMPWAKFKGEKSGVKLHIALNVTQMTPSQVEETIASRHDGPVGEKLANSESILVEDRAYGKLTRFDEFKKFKQWFVIRIKENITTYYPSSLKSILQEDSTIIEDITCKLGKGEKRTNNRFRFVKFKDFNGKTIRVCTNIMYLHPEKIADIYKERWKVETFFRFIKQNLNVKRLFGTSQNAVYNQLFCALMAYILLYFVYAQASKRWKYVKLSLIQFIRKLCSDNLEAEVRVSVYFVMEKIRQMKVNYMVNIS
ncbi:MAG: IS4 family transposase [Anaeromicrobium sp.]|nr:IS4 family transposase [Anaeromicrobium sp.]